MMSVLELAAHGGSDCCQLSEHNGTQPEGGTTVFSPLTISMPSFPQTSMPCTEQNLTQTSATLTHSVSMAPSILGNGLPAPDQRHTMGMEVLIPAISLSQPAACRSISAPNQTLCQSPPALAQTAVSASITRPCISAYPQSTSQRAAIPTHTVNIASSVACPSQSGHTQINGSMVQDPAAIASSVPYPCPSVSDQTAAVTQAVSCDKEVSATLHQRVQADCVTSANPGLYESTPAQAQSQGGAIASQSSNMTASISSPSVLTSNPSLESRALSPTETAVICTCSSVAPLMATPSQTFTSCKGLTSHVPEKPCNKLAKAPGTDAAQVVSSGRNSPPSSMDTSTAQKSPPSQWSSAPCQAMAENARKSPPRYINTHKAEELPMDQSCSADMFLPKTSSSSSSPCHIPGISNDDSKETADSGLPGGMSACSAGQSASELSAVEARAFQAALDVMKDTIPRLKGKERECQSILSKIASVIPMEDQGDDCGSSVDGNSILMDYDKSDIQDPPSMANQDSVGIESSKDLNGQHMPAVYSNIISSSPLTSEKRSQSSCGKSQEHSKKTKRLSDPLKHSSCRHPPQNEGRYSPKSGKLSSRRSSKQSGSPRNGNSILMDSDKSNTLDPPSMSNQDSVENESSEDLRGQHTPAVYSNMISSSPVTSEKRPHPPCKKSQDHSKKTKRHSDALEHSRRRHPPHDEDKYSSKSGRSSSRRSSRQGRSRDQDRSRDKKAPKQYRRSRDRSLDPQDTQRSRNIKEFQIKCRKYIKKAESVVLDTWREIRRWHCAKSYNTTVIKRAREKANVVIDSICKRHSEALELVKECHSSEKETLISIGNKCRSICQDLDVVLEVFEALVFIAQAVELVHQLLERKPLVVGPKEVEHLGVVNKNLMSVLQRSKATDGGYWRDEYGATYDYCEYLSKEISGILARKLIKNEMVCSPNDKENQSQNAPDSSAVQVERKKGNAPVSSVSGEPFSAKISELAVPELEDSSLKSVDSSKPKPNISIKLSTKKKATVKLSLNLSDLNSRKDNVIVTKQLNIEDLRPQVSLEMDDCEDAGVVFDLDEVMPKEAARGQALTAGNL